MKLPGFTRFAHRYRGLPLIVSNSTIIAGLGCFAIYGVLTKSSADYYYLVLLGLALIVAGVVLLLLCYRFQAKDLDRIKFDYAQLSTRDVLTGLANRHRFTSN